MIMATITKQTVTDAAQTKLQEAVAVWVVNRMDDYQDGAEGVLRDLFHGGCISGIVSELVHYSDTVAFYEQHQEDIWNLAIEQAEEAGHPNVFALIGTFNNADINPGDYSQVANLMAWYAFEEAAR